MKTVLIIVGIILVGVLYITARFVLCSIIIYADMMKRKGLKK